jgi:hypothetical protein
MGDSAYQADSHVPGMFAVGLRRGCGGGANGCKDSDIGKANGLPISGQIRSGTGLFHLMYFEVRGLVVKSHSMIDAGVGVLWDEVGVRIRFWNLGASFGGLLGLGMRWVVGYRLASRAVWGLGM